MTSRTWVRRLFGRTPRTAKAPARFRPCLEALEDRLAPANFTLTSLADDGSVGTLAWAIKQADQLFEPSTITIPQSLNPDISASGSVFIIHNGPEPTIKLIGPLPTITGDLSIVGERPFQDTTPDGTTPLIFAISGEGTSRVFQVGTTGSLSLNDLVIDNGFTTDNGGAILNQGTLSLDNVTVTGNKAVNGGAIASAAYSTVTITDHSAITSNTATGSGGGIWTDAPAAGLEIDNSTISSNTATGEGGGVAAAALHAVFSHDTITGNTATGNGGGIWNTAATGDLEIDNSTITNNTAAAGGGVSASTIHIAFNDDTIASNTATGGNGGGIWVPGATGTVEIDNHSTITGNTATGGSGGGVAIAGALSVVCTGSTISSNAATASGGGFWTDAPAAAVEIDDSTITNNSATGNGGGALVSALRIGFTSDDIESNMTELSGGGVWARGQYLAFNQDTISNNKVMGVDINTVVAATPGGPGGLAEGGGVYIVQGATSIATTTISGNLVQGGHGGAGGKGTDGTSYGVAPAGYLGPGENGGNGGPGADGGKGGQAAGGGIAIDAGSLTIVDSTISSNVARGGAGGTGGAGGLGGLGMDGVADNYYGGSVGHGGWGGNGGNSGNGGKGGDGGPALGGGLFTGLSTTYLSLTDSTVADNSAITQAGNGGTGADGGNGGNADPSSQDDKGNPWGSGGNGGNGGDGGITGASGPAAGAGINIDAPTTSALIASSTIAFNHLDYGSASAASAGAKGLQGMSVNGNTATAPSNGHDGNSDGVAQPLPDSGGGIGLDNLGTVTADTFDTTLQNSIVADNTLDTTSASNDIAGSLMAGVSIANLIGTGGSGGLVNGQLRNVVNVSEPNLVLLGPWGGATNTVLLADGSPALGAGDVALAQVQGLTTDQRGLPRLNNGTVDIGAVEMQAPVPRTIVVTTLHDEDDGSIAPTVGQGTSLREAIAQANLWSTATITFAPGLTGTITLTLGQLDITGSMEIDGPGANRLSISGNNASRVFAIDNGSANVTIRGLSIIDGNASAGGGIFNQGSLTLDSVVVSNNNASSQRGNGGGIWSAGTLAVSASTVANNLGISGGGIYFAGSSLNVTNSTITANTAVIPSSFVVGQGIGGGICVDGANSSGVLTNVTVAGNQESELGLREHGQLTVSNSIIGASNALDGTINSSGFFTNLLNPIYGNVFGVDLKLGHLQDNGGPTPTMAPMADSPALGAGQVNLVPSGVTTDQRGVDFPRLRGTTVDSGAYEVQLPSLSGNLPDGAVGTSYQQALTATEPGGAGGPYSFAVTAGTLPTGLHLAPDGKLTGTPTALGTFTFTVTATDSGGYTGSQAYTVTVTPAVTASTASLALAATQITIHGFGFDPTAANNTVAFNDGAVGTVTQASATALTVTFSTRPTAGTLTAVVTTDNQSSGAAIQVATIAPVVASSTGRLALNGTILVINGRGFDPTPAHNAVTLGDGAVGTVTAATATSLLVTLSKAPSAVANLTAVVTTNGVSSGTALPVARVVAAIRTPTVASRTAALLASANSIAINGRGFDATAANNRVTFNDGAVGIVTAATATALTVTFTTRPATAGNLTAVVTTDGVSSGAPVQVATVKPVVTRSMARLAANAISVAIDGFGFDLTAANNTVLFNDGAVGTVTAATATSLTVTFSTRPARAGSLTAVVTSNGISSGAAVQVATVP